MQLNMHYDLNCDLGEGETSGKTRALMRHVTSVNIACGGHAGDLRSMIFAVEEAIQAAVHIGAHPGLPDRSSFGRGKVEISRREFETLLVHQIGALEKVAARAGASLHHVKLHGALYHLTDSNAEFTKAYVSIIKRFWPAIIIFARAGGRTQTTAERDGLTVWPEGFLDRRYLTNGTLAPRGSTGAVLEKAQFKARLNAVAEGRSPVKGPVRTWCIHSDTPNAVEFARLARNAFV